MKSKFLRELKSKGYKILMVGDGLNDASSLAKANVSMSPSTTIDITQNTADIVFQRKRLSPVIICILVSKYSISLAKQNFGMALLYNIVAIPVAIIGLVTYAFDHSHRNVRIIVASYWK